MACASYARAVERSRVPSNLRHMTAIVADKANLILWRQPWMGRGDARQTAGDGGGEPAHIRRRCLSASCLNRISDCRLSEGCN
eukprot:scaffold8412_cov142-Isochrysis_galbana.AAC.3